MNAITSIIFRLQFYEGSIVWCETFCCCLGDDQFFHVELYSQSITITKWSIHQHYHCKCFEWAIKFFGEIEWLWNFVRQVCAEWNDKAILIAQNNLFVSVVASEQLPCRYLVYTSRIIGSNLIEARESSTHVFHLLRWFDLVDDDGVPSLGRLPTCTSPRIINLGLAYSFLWRQRRSWLVSAA